MKNLRFQVVIAIIALFSVAGLAFAAGSGEPSGMEVFAKCLAGKNATMYGSFLCSHCEDQKNLFGPSFRYVHYVECSVAGSRQITVFCSALQIRYTPTWIFDDGERRTGLQSLKSLSDKTGCRLP